MRPKPKARQDLFEQMTREECWLIGLIWADGCLCRAGGSRNIQVVTTDEELADLASKISGAPKRTRRQGPNRKVPYSVAISGIKVVNRLIKIGLESRKSLTASMPSVPHPAEFVRGYFDGDGTVGLYRSPSLRSPNALPRLASGFVGSHQMMTDLQSILERDAGIAPKKIHTSGPVWRLSYNHRDSLRLAAYMYRADGPCLSRKRAIFEEGAAQPFPTRYPRVT